jgi:aspartyl-tRNA(Asn)/glutamyl-tRNA(Gln) amidotransferase subunit A
VQEGALPLDLGFMTTGWPVIGQTGLAWLFGWHPGWRDGASAKYLQMADTGARIPASDLWQIRETVAALRREVAHLFTRIDLVVTPATAALPWPADEAYPAVIDGQAVGPRGHAIFTAWVNAAGLPAVALPTAPSREGLPIGVQIVGAYGSDAHLLDLAAAFEAASPRGWNWPAL